MRGNITFYEIKPLKGPDRLLRLHVKIDGAFQIADSIDMLAEITQALIFKYHRLMINFPVSDLISVLPTNWDPNDVWGVGHEWGHLVGLNDRYSDVGDFSVADKGWEGNIMGETEGVVQQRNINGVLGGIIKGFNKSKKAAETFNKLRGKAIEKGYGETLKEKHSVPGEDYEYKESINTLHPSN